MLKDVLYAHGPIPTAMEVYDDFFSYTSGVYSYTSGSHAGGHAILLVGYDDAGQYLIAKNSWGSWWGESGYFRIAYSQLTSVVHFGEYTIYFEEAIPPGSETVSSPTTLSDTTGGTTGTSYNYSTSGAASSAGHGVQYLFDWGDGSNSDWLPAGTTTASKSWSSAGAYSVKSQARCSTDTSITSGWSSAVGVTIVCPTPGAPSSPSPTNGATGASTSPTLSWAASLNAGSYDVYFGTSSPPLFVGNTTSASYSPPALSYSTTYYWKVEAKNNCGNFTSGTVWSFTTSDGSTIPVTLLQPNGGETIAIGSMYPITWNAPPQAVKFTLSYSLNNGSTWRSIASRVTGTSYSWKVPALTNSYLTCRLRVVGLDSKGRKAGEDRSDAPFVIRGVRVTAPELGMGLTGGSSERVSWETIEEIRPVQDVRIYLSRNGGASWKLIATVEGNPGIYSWSVPSPVETQNRCKIKVVLRDLNKKTLTTDIGEGYFTIEATP
jgi:hypothetical protein